MGHYSEYYEEEAEKTNRYRKIRLTAALSDLIGFSQYNAKGKSVNWTFSEIGLEKEYNDLVDKVKARLYDLEGVKID